MEVYFLDVGQGTCNVILVGGRKALVIDTGRRAADLRLLLNHLQVAELPCLALSHLDSDHAGGAPALLTEFRGRIGRICYPNDHRVMETPFWQKLTSELKGGHLEADQLFRMECQDRPKVLWRSPSAGVELKIFSPTFAENQLAMRGRDANATSGVLVLKVSGRCLAFPGDSSLEQWREIRRRLGKPLTCDVVTVPHHAGMIWPANWADAQVRAELEWLYSDAVQARYAVVSVGTSNQDSHPREDVMSVLRKLGVRILCTQITARCSADLESLRPGVLMPLFPGRAKPATSRTTSGNSRDLACAGTVVADVGTSGVTIHRFASHQAAVNRLPTIRGVKPLCR